MERKLYYPDNKYHLIDEGVDKKTNLKYFIVYKKYPVVYIEYTTITSLFYLLNDLPKSIEFKKIGQLKWNQDDHNEYYGWSYDKKEKYTVSKKKKRNNNSSQKSTASKRVRQKRYTLRKVKKDLAFVLERIDFFTRNLKNLGYPF